MSKILIVATAIILGVILLPVQIFYCVFFSGAHLAEYEITPNQAISIPLSPEMNPIRFNAKLVYEEPHIIGIDEKTRYTASLSDDKNELWSESFGVEVNDNDNDDDDVGIRVTIGNRTKSTTTSVHSFRIDEANDFDFVAKETRYDEINVKSITLKVRRNVRQVVWQLAVAGGGLILGGILYAVFGGRKAATTQPRHQHKSTEQTVEQPIDPQSPFE